MQGKAWPALGRWARRRPAAVMEQSRQGPILVLHVIGDLDMLSSTVLQETLDRLLLDPPAEARTLVLDLSEVGLLGAAGLAVLDQARRDCHGVLELRVVATGPVLRSLRISDLADVLTLEANLERALAAARRSLNSPDTSIPTPYPVPAGRDDPAHDRNDLDNLDETNAAETEDLGEVWARADLAGLPGYLHRVATAVGVDPAHVEATTSALPATGYLALSHRLASFPELDLALLWDEESGWAAALETPAGELILLDCLTGDVLPAPHTVADFLTRLRATLYPGQKTRTRLRTADTDHNLATRLNHYAQPDEQPPHHR